MSDERVEAAPAAVITFWRDAGKERWFGGGEDFDAEVRSRFAKLHHAAARGELDDWTATAEGALALLLLLDQFPRNLFRNSAHAYATDPLARRIARAAIARGFHREVEPALRPFFALPFEHSEALDDQDTAVLLSEALDGDDGGLDALGWATKHRDVIRRFGRFPHRNRALGRESTPEEQAYLDGGGGFA